MQFFFISFTLLLSVLNGMSKRGNVHNEGLQISAKSTVSSHVEKVEVSLVT